MRNTRKMSDHWAALALSLALLLSLAACGREARSTPMHLKRTEGTVAVFDDKGKNVPLLADLGLYSGYEVDTRSESYAWINLDGVKLVKMDQDSEIEIQKDGGDLEIEVKSGSLFFNVTEPLENDETMSIRASTMLAGIRGACGWAALSGDGEQLSVCLLEGRVRCEADGEKETVRAGEMAVMTEDGEITVTEFTARDIPDFVMEEIEDDDDLIDAILEDSGIDILNPEDPAIARYRTILAQADSYFAGDADYGDTEVTITYQYALAQMQAGSQIPALVLEQETSGDYWGDLCSALISQYDPNRQAVIQVEGALGEGAASAGGYRGALTLAGDGAGILEASWSSGTGMGSICLITVEGDILRRDTVFDGFLFDEPSAMDEISSLPIDWHDISDLSGLDSWEPPSAAPVQPPEPTPSQPEPEPTASALPADGDRIVLRGTLGIYSDEALIALQNLSEEEAQWLRDGQTYCVIVLDQPQTIALSHSGSQDRELREGEVSLIAIFADGYERYAGQHLTFSIDPYETWFPSDVSLPLGQPRTNGIHVLEAAP